jgi:hypothetical protein
MRKSHMVMPFIIAASGLLTSGAIAQWQGMCTNGHWVQYGYGYMCVKQQDIPRVYGPREYAPQGQASPSPINPYDNALTREFSRLGSELMGVAPLPDNVPLSSDLQSQGNIPSAPAGYTAPWENGTGAGSPIATPTTNLPAGQTASSPSNTYQNSSGAGSPVGNTTNIGTPIETGFVKPIPDVLKQPITSYTLPQGGSLPKGGPLPSPNTNLPTGQTVPSSSTHSTYQTGVPSGPSQPSTYSTPKGTSPSQTGSNSSSTGGTINSNTNNQFQLSPDNCKLVGVC